MGPTSAESGRPPPAPRRAISPRRRPRRGASIIYVALLLTLLCGLSSLGVDYARVQLAKTELRRAVDAAARAALGNLPAGIAAVQDAAVACAADNKVDGAALVLDPANDVEFGTWDAAARTFTPLAGAARANATALRLTARRTAARGTALPLFFARVIGKSDFDIQAVSVVSTTPAQFGIVGLNSITMGGNSSDSYWSANGSAPTGGALGSIGSNGPITLSGSASIHGNARPGIGYGVSGATKVSGSTSPLTTPLVYPNGNVGSAATVNNNASVPATALSAGSFSLGNNKSATLPGGVYYFDNFSMSGSASLTFTGPATIYCYGTVSLGGSTGTAGSLPSNLKLIMVNAPDGSPPGGVSIGGSSSLFASIYAPQSDVSISGTGDLYGSVVGLTVSMGGSSAIHFDLSASAGGSDIHLVQ